MVKDRQVKRLWRALSSGKTLAQSADKAGMDEKTARKHRQFGRLLSEVAPERTWRTRNDPFPPALLGATKGTKEGEPPSPSMAELVAHTF